jgi:magnesium transporter
MPEVSVRWLAADGILKHGDIASLDDAKGAAWVWVDVVDPDDATLALLGECYPLHELNLEDAKHRQHRAKLDQYDDGLFLVWLTPERTRGDSVTVGEIDVFIAKDYLITLHAGANKAVEQVVAQELRSTRSGPAWILHEIVDRLVDSSLPLVDRVGERLTTIEDRMLDNPRQGDLKELHQVRRQLVRLHRIIAPERDLLRGLARESDVISSEAYRYFQDVGDHIARALDSIETYQDVGASVMDVYLSAQSNRMNAIMKQLTVVATIFMPLTFISGIYGMNLTAGMWPPAGDAHAWSFWAVIGGLVVLSAAMAIYFRKKNWW